jgi:DNA-directed RNA polymerase III subunit RPC8
LEDKLRVAPEEFERNITDVVQEQIELKYVDKVIPGVGLGVCFYDFITVGEAFVYPAEGGAHMHVQFRLVFFCPKVGETIVGKIDSITPEHVRVSVDFFNDIYVPSSLLHTGTEWDSTALEGKGSFVWDHEDKEEEEEALDYRVGWPVRVRVSEVNFQEKTTSVRDSAPGCVVAVAQSEPTKAAPRPAVDSANAAEESEKAAPVMSIFASANEDGMGMTSWWGS